MSKHSELAEEIKRSLDEAESLRLRKFNDFGHFTAYEEAKRDDIKLIDQKLSGVRLSVEQAYIETLSTPHQEAWQSIKTEE